VGFSDAIVDGIGWKGKVARKGKVFRSAEEIFRAKTRWLRA
jgi:hypothetical protein